jgi:uncharacterized surface protein with fasciclin (FAS1) repeats
MKNNNRSFKQSLLALMVLVGLTTASCNKELDQIAEIPATQPSGKTLNKLLEENPDDTLFVALINRAGLMPLLSDSNKSFTVFVPDKTGLKSALSALTGGLLPAGAPDIAFLQFINSLEDSIVKPIIAYHIVPQKVLKSQLDTSLFNTIYPTMLADTTMTPLGQVVRLASFPSSRNRGWYNNVPVVNFDQQAYNGVIHRIATIALPTKRTLWDRISTDEELTYLKAAILRADSGSISDKSLQYYFSNYGPQFTVFAPVDTAFRKTLTGLIYNALKDTSAFDTTAFRNASLLASSPNVFSNPVLFSTMTAKLVKGVVVYHLLGKKAYSNNFLDREEPVQTLLNTDRDFRAHPGLKIKAGFASGVPFPISVSIKDIYNNSPAANVIMSAPLTPEPLGKSDQNYFNGVLHKIDRVLLPL